MSNDKTFRGGSWYTDADYCHSTSRYGNAPSGRRNDLGFRLIEEPYTTRRVLRGGGWFISPWFLRSAHRNRNTGDGASNFVGIRLVEENQDD